MHAAIVATQQGPRPARQGNDDPAFFRQGVWKTAGEDRWIAISLRTEEEWQRLLALCEGESLDAWLARQQDRALTLRLQAAGIACGLLQDIEDLFEHDETLRLRGALVELPHPALGPFGHVRTPVDFSRTPPQPFRAPALGEHNGDIAARFAGLSVERVAELQVQGVLQ
jgi:crotonobetainyl-CoA:carnitine CoA-transferase CaiB-like acyl-CoA transferase